MKKRVLSLILSLSILLTMCPITVWAADADMDTESIPEYNYDSHKSTETADRSTTRQGGTSGNSDDRVAHEVSGGDIYFDAVSQAIVGCNYNVTSAVIPASINGIAVTRIEGNAFEDCGKLTSIIIPDSVTSIGDEAFRNCSKLTSITIPDGVTSIGNYTFYACSELTSITIPNSVTSIGRYVFGRCSKLTSITIPDSVTSIGNDAFYSCSGLTSITIPNSVISIGERAFSGCSALTSITIPNSVTSMGNNAFSFCSALTSITIPNSITCISKEMFYACSSLTSITIPDSVTSIDDWAFNGCSSLKSAGPIGSKSNYEFGWTQEIPDNAFQSCSGLTSVTIPNSITSIGDDAFEDCSGLTSITIPNSVTVIGRDAFSGCSALTSITIPDSVSYINIGAFRGCNGLTSITISEGVTSIGDGAFSGCSSLTSITIPNSVTSIGSSAFSDCSSLTSITIPNSVTSIDSFAFSDCSSLTSIIIPNSITKIINNVFENCSGLTSIAIPNSVTSIGSSAFSDCSSLTSITIPNSVTSISKRAFGGCSSLTSITIPNSISYIHEGVLSGCSGLTNITIPDSVTGIDWYAFSGCSGLTSITIPNSVISIGSYAFNNCSGLTDVYYAGGEEDWKTIKIGGSNDSLASATIHYNSTGPDEPAPGPGPDEPNPPDEPKGPITFPDGDEYTIKVNKTISLEASIPDAAELLKKDITWSSSDEEIVALDKSYALILSSGTASAGITLKGVANGKATVTVSTSDGRSASVSVTVGNGMSETNFDPDIYRANLLSDTSEPGSQTMRDYFALKTPCGIFVPKLQENGFREWKLAWDGLTTAFDAADKPSTLIDFAFRGQDIYSAILLEMLQVANESSVADSCETLIKDTNFIISQVNDILKSAYDINVSEFDWSNLSEDETNKLKEACEKVYKEQYFVDIQKLDYVFKEMDVTLLFVDGLEKSLNKITTAIALTSMSESLKNVVRTMQERCPNSNVYLKLALSDVKKIIDSSTAELIDKLASDVLSIAGVDVSKWYIDKLWEYAVKSNPVITIFLVGYKSEKYFSNMLFSTDSTLEQYCIMLAALDVENLMADVFQHMEKQYLQSGGKDAALTYLSAIDLTYASRDYDCISAYKFVDILDDTLVNSIAPLFDPEGEINRDRLKNSIGSIQRSYNVSHEMALTGWIDHLEEDYPGSNMEEQYRAEADERREKQPKKKYVAACPVDVYVYDQNNSLVASVVDREPSCTGNLTIAVNGDKKEILFYDNNEYRIEYVGTDEGTMDVTVTEYDELESVVRDVYFYDVPLEKDKKYTTDVKDEILDETEYALISDTSNTVGSDLDTLLPEKSKRKVNVNSGSLSINNEIFFSTKAYPGEQLDIYAYVPEGCTFSGWTSNAGTDIFADPEAYATTVRVPDEDITVTATYDKAKYSISFDANGGSGKMDKVSVSSGEIYTLPDCIFTPPSGDLEFDAWAIGSINGTKAAANSTYTFTADTTVYALWTNKSNPVVPDDNKPSTSRPSSGSTSNSGSSAGGGASYSNGSSVSVSKSENGSVSISPSKPKKGETVIITVTPKDGYELGALTVNDSSGKAIDITEGDDGKYTFTMPAGKVTITPAFTKPKDTPDNDSVQQPNINFTDVPSDAYYSDAVAWAIAQGITNGTTETTFSPDNSCTRAQMVTFLWRSAGSPAPSNETNPFKDVAAGIYYYDAVLWAVEHGITTGTTDVTFSPNNTVTRGQTVTFLHRDAGSPKIDALIPFEDIIGYEYYADAVTWAAHDNITKGTTDTRFCPNEKCTRGQIVTFLYRYKNK